MPISIGNTYQSDYDWKTESDKLNFSDTFIDNSVDESLTTKERILKDANDEISQNEKNDASIDKEILPGINKKITNMIPPAGKFDKVVAEKTIAINALVEELRILTVAINATGLTGCGTKDGEGNFTGTDASYDVVNAGRNDSEDETYRGVNPFATTVYGENTAMTTGTAPTTIITNNLGIGVTTRIGSTGTFLARGSSDTDDDGNDNCRITIGDAYGSVYGHVNTLFSARRTALLGDITALRADRNAYMQGTVNELKREIKKQYTERHSFNYSKQRNAERKAELDNIITMTSDESNESFFT
tara:strand:- start:74 stop:979 length:906 start_codon:yes stop_codon:yes gene_type:complete